MYCGKCGFKIADGTSFCPNCGKRLAVQSAEAQAFAQPGTEKQAFAQFGAETQVLTPPLTGSPVLTQPGMGTQIPAKSGRVKKIIIFLPIAVIVSAVAIITVVALIIGNQGYEKTLDKFYEAIETQDAELMRSTLAQYWIDYQIADYDTDEYLESDIEDIIEDYIDLFDCGRYIEITYSVTGEKDASDSELEELKANIYDWYAYYVYDESEFYSTITDAKVVTVTFEVDGNEDTDTFVSRVLLIKENGEWKISAGGLDNSFYSNY